MTDDKVNPFPGQMLADVEFDDPDYHGPAFLMDEDSVDNEDAKLVTSHCVPSGDGPLDPSWHKPVIDIDLPVKVLESSTPGHHHLFIDKAMSWHQYVRLLEALVLAGVVEPGYLAASQARGFTAVRLPWVKKQEVAA